MPLRGWLMEKLYITKIFATMYNVITQLLGTWCRKASLHKNINIFFLIMYTCTVGIYIIMVQTLLLYVRMPSHASSTYYYMHLWNRYSLLTYYIWWAESTIWNPSQPLKLGDASLSNIIKRQNLTH